MKESNKIDWPDGKSFALRNIVNPERVFYFSDKPEFVDPHFFEPKNPSNHRYSSSNWDLIAKPSQSVFTKEMQNAGKLPEVGMKFLHEGKVVETLSTTKAQGGVVTFIRDGSIACCWNNNSWVKAIDNRTDKEKAKEDMEYHLEMEGIVTYDSIMLSILIEKVLGDKIHGVKWVGKE